MAAARALRRLALAALASMALCGGALADVPLKILAPVVPNSPVFGYLPGGTVTGTTLYMAMPNNARIPLGTLNPTAGTFTPWGLDGAVPTAASNLALAAYFGSATVMRRLGHDTPGDTIAADYTLAPGPCPIPGGDGGSQIPRALGGCWTLNPTMRVPLSLWAGKGSADDTAAWNAALAYLGAQGGPRMLWDDLAGSTVAGPRLIVPPQVTVSGDGRYEGSDNPNLPTVTFTNPAGGFYCSPAAGFSGINLAAGNPKGVDHLVELGGQCGIEHFRYTYNVSGILVTRTISPGVSSANLSLNGTSGLQSGTYPGRIFTGGGGSGASVAVTVQGGAISAVTPDRAGTGYQPWFDYGFAAGALYPGSPAIPAVGQVATAGIGRTRIEHVFGIAAGATNIGLELDAAYDFVTLDDVEMWSPGGIQGPSIGYRFGHLDGASLSGVKGFGLNTGIQWSAPTTGAQSLAVLTSPEFDYVNLGINITFPLDQLSISGGYIRSIGKSLIANAPTLRLTDAGTNFITQADVSIALQDFKSAAISSPVFASGNTSTDIPQIAIGLGSGSMIGDGGCSIVGAVFDGTHPGILGDVTAKGCAVGMNSWPGRKYPATYANGTPTRGYFTAVNAGLFAVDAIRRTQIGITADGNGYYTWTHALGTNGQSQSITLIGACAAVGYRAAITSLANDSVTFQVLQANGQPAPNAQCAVLVGA